MKYRLDTLNSQRTEVRPLLGQPGEVERKIVQSNCSDKDIPIIPLVAEQLQF